MQSADAFDEPGILVDENLPRHDSRDAGIGVGKLQHHIHAGPHLIEAGHALRRTDLPRQPHQAFLGKIDQ